MSQDLLGAYECKIDSKGRLRIPTGLLTSLSNMGITKLVIKRGFEKCLNLYPYKAWKDISVKLDNLNDFVKKNRDFKRYFRSGATEIDLVGNDRILVQKPLLEYAGIDKDVTLAVLGNNLIEIWSTEAYKEFLENEPEDFSAIGESVMGDVHFGGVSNSDSGGPL